MSEQERFQPSGRFGRKGTTKRDDSTGLEIINTTVKSRTKAALRRIAADRRVSMGVVLDMMVASAEKMAKS